MLRRHWVTMIAIGAMSRGIISGQSYPFLVDPSKPFVYLKFNRIGPRKPAREGELPIGLWLDLVNNCRMPVTVIGHDLGTGDPGAALDYRVVSSTPASETTQSLPKGYSFHVGSPIVVVSGKRLLFSIPADHVTDDWHIEIDVRIDTPRGSPESPRTVVPFFSINIPRSSRSGQE